jgi:hypothetical protein
VPREDELAGPLLMDATTFMAGINTGVEPDTETFVFEFAAAATQDWRMSRDGHIVGIHCSTSVVGVSVGQALPTNLPNGGQTRILTGYVVASGVGFNTANGWVQRLNAPFKTGDVLSVKVTASAVVHIVVTYLT